MSEQPIATEILLHPTTFGIQWNRDRLRIEYLEGGRVALTMLQDLGAHTDNECRVEIPFAGLVNLCEELCAFTNTSWPDKPAGTR